MSAFRDALPADFFKRVVIICSLGVIGFALLGLVSQYSGVLVLSSIRPDYIPMAASTAWCFLSLGAILLLETLGSLSAWGRAGAKTVTVLVAVFALLNSLELIINVDFSLEEKLFPTTQRFGEVLTNRISPLTTIIFFLAGINLLLILERKDQTIIRHLEGFLGFLVTACGFICTIGYLFGTPLLYGGEVIPVALSTAGAFLLLGVGLVAGAGPQALPLQLLVGPLTRARMLRVFLPLTVGAILLHYLLHDYVRALFRNQALGAAVFALGFALITGGLVIVVGQAMGEALERAEAALRQSEEKYRILFETAVVGGFQSTPEGRFLSVNPTMARMFGYGSPQEMIEQVTDIGRQLWVHPESREEMKKIIAQKGFLEGFEAQVYRRDGEIFWISADCRVAHGPKGEMLYIEGFMRNITDRKWAEAALIQAHSELEQKVQERTAELVEANNALLAEMGERKRKELKIRELNQRLKERLREIGEKKVQLEAANQELESFSYAVSHDLRAPLRIIDGFCQALRQDCSDKLDSQGQDYLKRILRNTRRMEELIDSLLVLSRLTRREMRREKVDLGEIARKLTDNLGKSDPQRQVELVIAPGLEAEGDLSMLRVVLENLLNNAWKFTGEKAGARIEVGVLPKKDGSRVFYVRDNGAGFDMAFKDKLFGAFQRLHGQEEFPGIGIGLATVQRIINRHGGRVWAEGAVDQGAVFYFTLSPTG